MINVPFGKVNKLENNQLLILKDRILINKYIYNEIKPQNEYPIKLAIEMHKNDVMIGHKLPSDIHGLGVVRQGEFYAFGTKEIIDDTRDWLGLAQEECALFEFELKKNNKGAKSNLLLRCLDII